MEAKPSNGHEFIILSTKFSFYLRSFILSLSLSPSGKIKKIRDLEIHGSPVVHRLLRFDPAGRRNERTNEARLLLLPQIDGIEQPVISRWNQ